MKMSSLSTQDKLKIFTELVTDMFAALKATHECINKEAPEAEKRAYKAQLLGRVVVEDKTYTKNLESKRDYEIKSITALSESAAKDPQLLEIFMNFDWESVGFSFDS